MLKLKRSREINISFFDLRQAQPCKRKRGITHCCQLFLLLVLASTTFECLAAEPWDFLSTEPGNIVGVRGIEKHLDGELMSFNMLNGYLPQGRDLGVGKMVGARTRHFIYKCGASNIMLTDSWHRDIESKLIFEKKHDPMISIAVNSEPSLVDVTRYVCGDKSVKSFNENSVGQNRPKDTIILLCKFDAGNGDLLFQVSETERSVNGASAIFSDGYIIFSKETNEGVYVTRVNRYSGRFTAENSKAGITLSGSCVTQAKKQF